MFVQIVEHLPQLLHGLFGRLQEHSLKVHGQPISGEIHYIIRSVKKKLQRLSVLSEYTLTYSLLLRSTDLKTDSTKTLNALMWIHAMKASLKFTFSHRTSGPYRSQRRNVGFTILMRQCLSVNQKYKLHLCNQQYIPSVSQRETLNRKGSVSLQATRPYLWWTNSDENKEKISNISCFLTNCFFLSVESLFISSLSAFISSSLYWKSLTMNLGKQSSRQESGSLVHCSSHTFSLSGWC